MSKEINIILGDITEYKGDAIVNAANNHFWMGGGVAGAIKRKGGEEIEQEAMKQGPKPVGESIITSGGNLSAKYVIHAAVMGQDLQTDETKIKKATISALRLADQNNIRTIAFPALGTGVGGFPMEKAAKIMLSAAKEYLQVSKKIEKVTFVLYDQDGYNVFKKELENIEKPLT
ncbi:MAG: macro domain-containing protein [Candidatus Kryptoniota bacterium]